MNAHHFRVEWAALSPSRNEPRPFIVALSPEAEAFINWMYKTPQCDVKPRSLRMCPPVERTAMGQLGFRLKPIRCPEALDQGVGPWKQEAAIEEYRTLVEEAFFVKHPDLKWVYPEDQKDHEKEPVTAAE